MIRTVIVDDLESSRTYLSGVLEHEPKIHVVGTATSGSEAVQLVQQEQPDVVLMDIQMETYDAGIVATEIIHRQFPEIKVIIITIHAEDALLFRAYAAGAMDYIVKTDPAEMIVQSVKDVYGNQLMLRPAVAEKIRLEFNRYMNYHDNMVGVMEILTRLTNSEMEILKAVYHGYTNREIADMRFVSLQTIKTQVNSILKKFGKRRMKEVVAALHLIDFDNLTGRFYN